MKKKIIDNEMKNLLHKLLEEEEFNLIQSIVEKRGNLDIQEEE